MTYKFHELTKRQQNEARRARDKMHQDGWGVSVSQLAKYFDDTEEYLAGAMTAEELAPIVSAVKPS